MQSLIFKSLFWSCAPLWEDTAPTVLQPGRESSETSLPVPFQEFIHWWLEVETDLCHKGEDIAPRKGPQTWAVQRGSVSFWTYHTRRSTWILQLECYLMKVSISRLGIPSRFSTFSLTFSEKPPGRRQWKWVKEPKEPKCSYKRGFLYSALA